MSKKSTEVLEWSRWCPYPKTGMRVEYVTADSPNITHGVAWSGYFRSDAGVEAVESDIKSWRPESGKVKSA